MGTVIQRYVVGLMINFAMRQYGKFLATIDWVKVKIDWEPGIRRFVPGTWLDNEAVGAAFAFLDAVAAVMAAQSDIEKILRYLTEENYQAAWEVIRDLILNQWEPKTPAEHMAYSVVKGHATLGVDSLALAA
jgi:hypothetical protein